MCRSLSALQRTRVLNSFRNDEMARTGSGSDPGCDLAATFGFYPSSLPRLGICCTAPVKRREQRILSPVSRRPRLGTPSSVPCTRGSTSGALIQNEWGLDLCSSPPRCSLSLGPLVWPTRRERPGLPAVKPRESMGRAGGRERGLRPCGAAVAHRPVRRRRRPSEGRCASTRRKNCLLWKPGPLAWQPSPRSPHACLPAVDSRPLARCETVAICAGQKSGGNTRVFQAPSCFSKNHGPPQRRTTERGLLGPESCFGGSGEERGLSPPSQIPDPPTSRRPGHPSVPGRQPGQRGPAQSRAALGAAEAAGGRGISCAVEALGLKSFAGLRGTPGAG